MGVNAVQNYGNNNNFSNILSSTVVGGIIGYGAKGAIPLRAREKKDIPYRAIVNVNRKAANLQKANSFKVLKSRTAAQDEFVKMIDNKTPFKHPALTDLAERLGGETTEIGKKVLNAIKESEAGIGLSNLVEKLGKDTTEAKELKRVSKLQNAFARENLNMIVRKLGGEESVAGKEFRTIIKEVDQNAATASRECIKGCHNTLKSKRYAAPLVITGAVAGFAAAFLHNVFTHKTEA